MFNLIITVISIALVAALALASIYYGGDALSRGSAKATAATLINQGQQLNGATIMDAQDNGGVKREISQVVTAGYLSAPPAVPGSVNADSGWAVADLTVGGAEVSNFVVVGNNAEVCLEMEKEAGREDGDSVVADLPTTSQGGTFGCFESAPGGSEDAAEHTFYYVR
ncbi:hypothetical protein J2T57_001313 [Natronocella acetinitrilica]|uniref:Uncharacterized protein n=1 Tax=Natronocella acetinitrilica TaxID=414046 RepID=A0AAE3KB43_9GAMM|nr:hypothetical protein [Natronocella acetinitrilica]MCP1674211.1 hypothetical protein [Natronocella acetinitrilica]